MINILNKYKINHAEFFEVLKAGTMHVNFSQIKGRLGFTLAEVLITLGIIGVVAAITIPNLIANQQKKAIVSGMIEAQSILNQALRSYAYDSDEDGTQSFETTWPIKEFAEKYFHQGTKLVVTGRIQTGSYTNKDGATVYTTDVVADRVEFLEWGDRNERQASRPAAKSSAPSGGFDAAPEGFSAIDEDIPF